MTTTTRPRRRLTSGGLALVCGVAALSISLGAPSEAAKLITGKDIKNNSVKGVDVDEATLTGVIKSNHVAAHGNASSAFVDDFTSANTSLISTSFDAPRNGFLYVTGAISAEDDASLGGDGRLNYGLRLDGTTLSNAIHELDYDGVAGGDSGATTAVVPVKKGFHTVRLTGTEVGTGSFITSREVSVMFVPSGSGFTPPAKPAVAPRHPQR